MTKLVICVVRDIKADVFGNPFFMQSAGQAERQFSDEINRAAEDNVMYKHPEDFELYHVGFYYADTGRFEILIERVQLAVGVTVQRKPQLASVS